MPSVSKSTKDKTSAGRRKNHASISWSWVADPPTRWRQHFDGWRMNIGEFRRWEKETFLRMRDKKPMRRAHLGWLCQLIAEGQQLAVELTSAKPRQPDQLKHLDNFLENLRTTFLVWHAPETVKQDQNPLAKYFD